MLQISASSQQTVANGTSVNGGNIATIVIRGGFPPYTIAWADNMANVFLSASSSTTPVFLATGTDVEHTGVVSVLVTDAASRTAEASAAVNVVQGNPIP